MLTLLFTTLALPLISWITTSYTKIPLLFHPKEDLFGWRLEGAMQSRFARPCLLPALATSLYLFLPIPPLSLRLYLMGVCLPLLWRGLTRSQDPAKPENLAFERTLFFLCYVGLLVTPATLFLFLALGMLTLRTWEHHTFTPHRILFLFLGCWPLSLLFGAPIAGTTLWLALACTALPYVRAGISKLQLSVRWPMNNRIDLLPRAAWLWGWRPLGWEKTLQLSKALRPVAPLIQLLTLLLEGGFALVLFSPYSAYTLLSASLVFHGAIFALAGVFFWEQMLANSFLLAALIATKPSIFGWESGALALLWICGTYFWRSVYKTKSLAWWDTALCNRIFWIVEGKSGKKYNLPNDFFGPGERLFGQKLPYSLTPYPKVTEHMGECRKEKRAQFLWENTNSPEQIKEALKQVPASPPSKEETLLAKKVVEESITNTGAGATERRLRYPLCAPPGQCFFWGDHPPYRGEEEITHLHVLYRISLFTDSGPVVVYEKQL